jgi:hypothetical protein
MVFKILKTLYFYQPYAKMTDLKENPHYDWRKNQENRWTTECA